MWRRGIVAAPGEQWYGGGRAALSCARRRGGVREVAGGGHRPGGGASDAGARRAYENALALKCFIYAEAGVTLARAAASENRMREARGPY